MYSVYHKLDLSGLLFHIFCKVCVKSCTFPHAFLRKESCIILYAGLRKCCISSIVYLCRNASCTCMCVYSLCTALDAIDSSRMNIAIMCSVVSEAFPHHKLVGRSRRCIYVRKGFIHWFDIICMIIIIPMGKLCQK